MNLLIAAQSGWGKSYLAQRKTELNLDDVSFFIALDYKDEYRGLVEGFHNVKWHPLGPKELHLTPDDWTERFLKVPKVVCPRYMLTDKEWRYVCANISIACRRLYERTQGKAKILILIDEAHAVAPQEGKYPEPIGKIAVAGRGENISTIWVTQRLAMTDKDIVSQCQAIYAGGFTESNDLKALAIDYPAGIHNPKAFVNPENVPDELKREGEKPNVRKYLDSRGKLIGSEWIYSDEKGNIRRESTKGEPMRTTHYGLGGYELSL